MSLPESFGGEGGEGQLSDRWWSQFGDRHLERLVDQALGGNFQLKAAWARLGQAEVAVGQAKAGRWPQMNLNADAQRAERFFPPFGRITQQTYQLSLPVSYEIDVWNKYGSGVQAAAAQVRATRDDLEATAMSLAAEVSEAWFDVLAARATDKLLRTQLEVNSASEELLETRFSQGLAAAVDVYQGRQQSITTRTQIEMNLGQLAAAENRLSILLGSTLDGFSLPSGDTLPAVPATPNVGVPADLLERRPDLRASRERLVAQDYLLAQRLSERLPSLTVGASLAFSATSLAELLDNLLRSISGSLMVPLIDGGRRAGAQHIQEAAVREALAMYGQTLLTALVEVENALALDAQQAKVVALLEMQRDTSVAALREAKARYTAGVDSYLPVLSANTALQSAERALLDAQRRRLSLRVQVFRALGGDWPSTLTRPEPPKES